MQIIRTDNKREIIIGTRGSRLALAQAEEVKSALGRLYPGTHFSVRIIKTGGDRIKEMPLSEIGGEGVFTKEIEGALLREEIDIAVHSAKDLPVKPACGLELAAVTKRRSPHDCLLTKNKETTLAGIRKIATGSVRRRTQLLNHNPRLVICGIRGNITTRIKKLYEEDFEAVVLAVCGINRLQIKGLYITILPFKIIVPAAGQGALALESRKDDREIKGLLGQLNHMDSYYSVSAERAFLGETGAGCRIPAGCLAETRNGALSLRARVLKEDGSAKIEDNIHGRKEDAVLLGKKLAERLWEKKERYF